MKNCILSLMAVGLAVWSASASAIGAASTSQPLSVQIALTSDAVTLGEPITLQYRIANSSDDSVSVDMGEDKRGWLSFSLVDALGTPAQTYTEILTRQSGIHSDGIRLDQHGESMGYMVIGRGIKPEHIGQYHLTIVANLGYRKSEKGKSESFSQRYVLPLTVTPKDTEKLISDAAALGEAAAHDTDVSERHAAVEALFLMPATEADPAWQALISVSDLPVSTAADIAKQLVRLNSVAGADLLAKMNWAAPPQWAGNGFAALQYLQELHGTGSQQVRQHIDDLFALHGERIPNRLIGDID